MIRRSRGASARAQAIADEIYDLDLNDLELTFLFGIVVGILAVKHRVPLDEQQALLAHTYALGWDHLTK